MKSFLVLGAIAMVIGVSGCAAEATVDAIQTGDSALSSQLGADEALRCTAQSKRVTLGLVPTKNGKAALLALTPKADLYKLSRSVGSLTSSSGLGFKGSSASLTLNTELKGKWEDAGQTATVTCAKVDGAEAASFRAANGLADYADEIDGIADAVLEESSDDHPKPYTVFAVETARRGSLALGHVVAGSAGKVSAHDPDEDGNLDQNDSSYGAMSAAYSLGGGEDYGEWFQGVSDGVSLEGDLLPGLGASAVAGFIAHEKVTALAAAVGSQNPSAVEITVGPWTFFLPDTFAK